MAHKILGNRFASRTAPAWHGLGVTFDEAIDATTAARLAGIDFPIEKRPMTVDYDGTMLTVPNAYAVLPGPLPDHDGIPEKSPHELRPLVLGTCSEEFEVLDNMDIARMIDPLTERYPIETCGALGDGEQTFFSLLAPETSKVAGDTIRNYFTLVDSKIPGARAKVFYSPVRVVCWNTLCRGLREATISFDVRHTRGAKEEFQFYSGLMVQMAEEQEKTLAMFRHMTAISLPSYTQRRAVDEIFPLPDRPSRVRLMQQHDLAALAARNIPGAQHQYERAKRAHDAWEHSCARVQSYRDTARELIRKFNDEHVHAADTLWCIYNACTEVSDWREGRGNVMASVLFGERAAEKARAWDVCTALLN